MAEIGEGVSVDAPETKSEPEKKGSLKVTVKDICSGDPIEGAGVIVKEKAQKTDSFGESTFSDLPIGNVSIRVKMHYDDIDYISFIVQYPRIYISHEAKSGESDFDDIEDGKESQIEIELDVFKLVGKIVFHRRHISPKGEDKYGHWWTVVNPATSYGWWPKYPLGSSQNRSSDPPEEPALLSSGAGKMEQVQYLFDMQVYNAQSKMYDMKESSPAQTLRGVEGEINGQTSFGGTPTRDPHHIGGDEGDEQYHPVDSDCFTLSEIESCIGTFAKNYRGGWSWRFEAGNHCHTFQKELIKHCELKKVKLVK